VITVSAEKMEYAERMLRNIPGAAKRAAANAINRASESARTEAARKVRELYYIKQSDVTSTIKLYRATPEDLSSVVVSRGNLLALSKFRVTPSQPQPNRRRPIIVRVKRGSGGIITGAFVARMSSGHIGVFNRIGKTRLPIIQRYGPSVPQMLGNPSVTNWVEQKAYETLDKRLDHEINRILEENT
jgi:hypothetical protein